MTLHGFRQRGARAVVAAAGLALAMAVAADNPPPAGGEDEVAAAVQPAGSSPVSGQEGVESRWAEPRYPGVKVRIDAAGNVFLDGQPATPDLMREAFSHMEGYGGVVWYHRENPSLEPQGQVAVAVDEVIGILSGYKLAVELFEAGFPDPEEHRKSLSESPPNAAAEELTPEARDGQR